jgi:hypothetical protein
LLISAKEAKALLVDYQFTTTVPFSTTGDSSPVSATLSFPRFDPSSISPDRANIVLKGYNYVLSSAALGGQVGVSCATFIPPGTCPGAGPYNVNATLSFGSISGGSAPTFSPITQSVTGPAPANATSNFPLNATVNSFLSSDVLFASGQAPNFTQPPSTPLPSLTGYETDLTLLTTSNQSVPGNVIATWAAATVSGSIGIRYIYEYSPLSAVPGPLPLVGVGAAFSWSRHLRKKVRKMASPQQS